MAVAVSIRCGLRETLSSSGVLIVPLLVSALSLLPNVGTWVSFVVVAGYQLSYQRRVRLGEPGLPPLRDVRDWLRRGIGVSAIVLSLVVPLEMLAIAVTLFLVIVLHVQPKSTAFFVFMWVGLGTPLLLAIVPLELLALRYGVYDRVSAGFQYVQAFRAMRPHWGSFGRVLVWLAAAVSAAAALRILVGLALGTRLGAPSTLVAPAFARHSVLAWLALV